MIQDDLLEGAEIDSRIDEWRKWSFFETFVGNNGLRKSHPPTNHRQSFDDVFRIVRTGASSRDRPEKLASWNPVYRP